MAEQARGQDLRVQLSLAFAHFPYVTGLYMIYTPIHDIMRRERRSGMRGSAARANASAGERRRVLCQGENAWLGALA